MVEIFFVVEDPDKNYKFYRSLIEEQLRIAYYSNNSIKFTDLENFTLEDRKIIVEVLRKIKKEEEEEIKKQSDKNTTLKQPTTISSLNK